MSETRDVKTRRANYVAGRKFIHRWKRVAQLNEDTVIWRYSFYWVQSPLKPVLRRVQLIKIEILDGYELRCEISFGLYSGNTIVLSGTSDSIELRARKLVQKIAVEEFHLAEAQTI